MPMLGLLLGHGLAAALGHATRWIGAGLLIATGIYALGRRCVAPTASTPLTSPRLRASAPAGCSSPGWD
jgi:hypothetical protein